MSLRLKNKVAIVTGASSGIGKGIALEFAKEGAKIIIADIFQRDQAGGKETIALIRELGGEAIFVKTDVRQKTDVEQMVKMAVETFGQLDILVNNAGIIRFGPFWEHTEEQFDAVIDTNMKGVFLCSQIAAKEMIKRGQGGKIISLASVESEIAWADHAPYAASKGGVAMMTKAMALELAPYRINVNAIGPGVIKTPVSVRRITGAALAETLAKIPWGRLGTPEDVAHVAVFLASDESDYMTGSIVYVDGGYMIQ